MYDPVRFIVEFYFELHIERTKKTNKEEYVFKKKRKHTFILSDLQSDIIQTCLPKINITILQYFDDVRNN